MVTFRLADSLPAEVLEQLRNTRFPRGDVDRRMRAEAYLDAGHGACYLRDPFIAKLVERALLRFDGERYRLLAWSVMPNHVHALVEILPGYTLVQVLHTWKSYTAHAANRALGRNGPFWQVEYWDRYVRSEEHLESAVRYIRGNRSKFSSAARERGKSVSNAGGTPALPGKPLPFTRPYARRSRRNACTPGGKGQAGRLRSRASGFTLIELLIVMVIIAIAFFALRPSFAGAIRGAQERSALRQLVGLFTSARTEAVATGRLVRVTFDPGARVFYAEIQTNPAVDRAAFEPRPLLGKRRVRLPEHLWMGQMQVGGQDLLGEGATEIYFYPDGRTDGAALELVDRYGGSIKLDIAPATGRIRVNA